MTKRETAAVADAMIEAAQAFERAARELKRQTTAMRRHGLDGVDLELWIMHKRGDVERAAERAQAPLAAALDIWRQRQTAATRVRDARNHVRSFSDVHAFNAGYLSMRAKLRAEGN